MRHLEQRTWTWRGLVEGFWKRWIKEYFPSLLVRSKWHTSKRNVKVGDIVLIQDTTLGKSKWKIGRISNVYPGSDDKVRNVDVEYKNLGEDRCASAYFGKGYTTIKRPVQRLIVLLPVDDEDVTNDSI